MIERLKRLYECFVAAGQIEIAFGNTAGTELTEPALTRDPIEQGQAARNVVPVKAFHPAWTAKIAQPEKSGGLIHKFVLAKRSIVHAAS